MRLLDSKVSPEGRVSIPVELRHQLGLQPGDRVVFLVDDDGAVRIVTAQWLAEQVWAANTGGDAGDAGDAGEIMRAARDADAAAEARAYDLDDLPAELPDDDSEEFLAALFPAA